MRGQRSKIVVFALALSAVLMVSSQVYAFCDIGGGRVVHAESTPFNSAATTATIFWIAPNTPTPTSYYRFATNNQTFINHLNAAQAGNLQVRVTGGTPASVCGALVGALRDGGTIVAVFRDSFN